MAEVTLRRAGEMVRALFGILASEPEGLAPGVALKRLAQQLPPSPFESAYYPNFPKIRR
ncbi:MAG TPA: hypothetical protein VNF73_08110 [Candidatus Saccharimonadales bacterium]|nr:hypothetical protein [Candidatus Saccharimonadales bacterium]